MRTRSWKLNKHYKSKDQNNETGGYIKGRK